MSLVWIFLILLLGFILMTLEVFVPSGGALGFCAGTCIVVSVMLGYYHHGLEMGTMVLGVAVVFTPMMLYGLFKVWPHTPLGRAILARRAAKEDSDEMVADSARFLKSLVGRRGRAISPLLPAGAVEIDGRYFDALTHGRPIEKNEPIEVVEATGNHLIVRPAKLTSGDGARQSATGPAPLGADKESPDSGQLLSQPFEDFGIDELEEPLK